MDLANLGFVVDTKTIKDGVAALRELQAAALGVTNGFKQTEKAVQNAGKTTEQTESKTTRVVKESANQKKKAQSDYLNFLDKAIDSTFKREQANFEAIKRQLRQVKIEAELAAKGLSRTTAVGVANLTQRGASSADINTFIRTRKEIERITLESKKAGVAVQGLSTILRQISPAVGAVGIVAVLTQMSVAAIRAADQMTLLKSRISFVLQDTANFDQVLGQLTNTANENRQGLTDIVTLFNRISPVLNKAGRSTAEVLTVVDSFSKTLLISGANTREASSAILQFSQAMAAGRLNGDEFRTITEAAPEFLRKFSEATGVAAGSLKELAADGKLTTEVISDALIVMSESVGDATGRIKINFSQAIQVLSNNLTIAVDKINTASGFTDALADTTLKFANFVKSATDSVISFFEANSTSISVIGNLTTTLITGYTAYKTLAFFAGASAIQTGIAAAASTAYAVVTNRLAAALVITAAKQKLLNLAVSANPFVLAGTAIITLLSAMDLLGLKQDEITAKQQQLSNLDKAREESLRDYTEAYEDYKAALASNDEKKMAEAVINLTRASSLYEVQTKNSENAQKGLNELMKGSTESLRATSEETAEASARLDDWAASLTGSNKSVEELRKKNGDLAFELDNVGKSTVEVAEAKRVLTLIEADQLIAESLLLQLSDKLSEADQDRILDLIEKAELLKKNSELEVRLAKAKALSSSATKSNNKAEKEAVKIQKDLEKVAQERIKDYKKSLEEIDKNTEAVLKEVEAIEEETFRIGLSNKQIRQREISLIESTIATKEAELASKDFSGSTYEEIKALEDFIAANKKKVAALKNQDVGLDQQDIRDKAKKAAEDTQKEFEKIQDDIAKSITDAIINGGKGGKEALKKIFEAQVFRIFVEPTIRGAVGSITNSLGLGSLLGGGSSGGASGGLDIAGIANLASQGSSGGLAGISLNKGLEQLALNPQVLEKIGNSIFFNTTGALSDVGRSLATNASSLSSLAGQIAPFAGSIVQLFQGDFGGALGSAVGTKAGTAAGVSIGNALGVAGSVAGPIGAAIGAAIGSALGGKLFGGGKISATALSPEFGAGVRETLEEQYLNIVRGLGGVAANVTFSAFGNTGRQGQNPNFTLGASVNGRNVFGSAQTREGQRDGLFLSGEIALNEVNLSDQSTRAIIAVLKETEFSAEINALFDSVNAATDSIDRLNDVLKQVEIVKFLSRNLTVFSANIRDLITTSADAFNKLVEMSGGTDAFAQALDLYVNTFATDTEKLANAQKVVADAFDTLNIAVPETQKELRALIDAQDLTTEAGRKTYLSLIGLIPAFTEVTNISNQFKAAQERLSQTISDSVFNIQTSFGNFLNLIQSRADSLEAGGFTDSVQAIEEQIAQLQSSVDIVDFSSFTRQMGIVSNNIATLTNEIANTTDVGTRLILEDQLQQSILARYQLEQELLGGVFATIQETLKAVTGERVAVRNAAVQILGGPRVLSPSEIRQKISEVSSLGSLPSLESAEVVKQQNLLNQKQVSLDSLVSKQQAEIAAKNKAILDEQTDVQKTAITYQKELTDVQKAAADAIAYGRQFTTVGGRSSSEQFARFGIKTDPTTGKSSADNAYFVANTAAFNAAFREFASAQSAYVFNLNQLNAANKIVIKTTDQQIEKAKELVALQTQEVEKAKADAEQAFAEQLQQFVIDAGKATSQLGKLREETVRYFEEQKRLAGEMIAASSNIRQTISNIRFADLAPQEQLKNLQNQFSKLFNQSLGLEGEALANVGNNLNSLIDPILQKAQELFASGPQFQAIKEALLAQAGEVATKIEMLTPVDYQQESLDLLDTIDTTLALIEENTKSAETLIVDAIGASTIKTVEALRAVIAAINGEPIPAFAKGGFHTGGVALVGEEGPELVNMGASRVFSANQTANILGGRSVDVTPVVEALNRVQDRTEFQIRVLQEGFRRMDERQQAMQEELTDIRKKGNLATQ